MAEAVQSQKRGSLRALTTTLFIGVFMSALDTAIIGPAIPVLRQAFAVDHRQVGLVMSVFVLCSLCSTVVMANLSDRHGRRPVFLISVGLFTLGSLLVALSPSFWLLIAARAVQGLGAGGVTPTASAVVGDVFPPEQRGRALGLIGATYGMAFVLGPPVAGAVMVALSWHWVFLLNLPVAAVVMVLGARTLPTHRAPGAPAPFDLGGLVVTVVLLGALVLGITRIVDRLVNVTLWPYLLAGVALAAVVLWRVERRAIKPLVPPSLFENRQLATVYLLTLGAGFGMGSVVFLSSIANLAYGVTPQRAGFALLPLVLCSMVGSMGAGRLLNRVGARSLVLVGFAMLAAGYGASAFIGHGLGLFLVASMPVGLGVGIVVGGALRSIAIEEAPVGLRASAQGLINICTAIGTLTSAAVVSAVADFRGGGAHGFAVAYAGVAALMVAMFLATFGLRGPRLSAQVEPTEQSLA